MDNIAQKQEFAGRGVPDSLEASAREEAYVVRVLERKLWQGRLGKLLFFTYVHFPEDAVLTEETALLAFDAAERSGTAADRSLTPKEAAALGPYMFDRDYLRAGICEVGARAQEYRRQC